MMTSFFAKLFGRRSGLHLLGDPAGGDGEQRARAMAAELRATRADKRLAAAINAGLPQSALALKEHAGTLLGATIDDDELRPTLGLAAFHAWLYPGSLRHSLASSLQTKPAGHSKGSKQKSVQ